MFELDGAEEIFDNPVYPYPDDPHEGDGLIVRARRAADAVRRAVPGAVRNCLLSDNSLMVKLGRDEDPGNPELRNRRLRPL